LFKTQRWKDWPQKKKAPLVEKTQTSPSQTPTTKRKRSKAPRVDAIAKEALSNGTVVNLTGLPIPNEAVAVLCKRFGFVETSKFDPLGSKTDCVDTMAKLSRATSRKKKQLKDGEDDDDYGDTVEIIPKCLRRKKNSAPYTCGDKVVDELKDELIKEVEHLNPPTPKSNLSPDERRGLKWIKQHTDPVKGKLRVVQADKGGAIIIATKRYIRELEQDKLLDEARYENLGTSDPTDAAQKSLLNLWRKGEDDGHVSREESKEVVGLCEKKVNKRGITNQQPSTLSVFKPGTPYFYGLLKIHKLKPEQLVPGVKVPIRLVTNLREAVTTRSDKFLNWKYLKPLQNEFCKDIVQDSTEVLQWLESVNNNKQKSPN